MSVEKQVEGICRELGDCIDMINAFETGNRYKKNLHPLVKNALKYTKRWRKYRKGLMTKGDLYINGDIIFRLFTLKSLECESSIIYDYRNIDISPIYFTYSSRYMWIYFGGNGEFLVHKTDFETNEKEIFSRTKLKSYKLI